MASHTSLRQASRIAQSNKSHIISSRLRQSSQTFNPNTLLSSRTASISRHPRIYSHHALQQTRNLSWWGSGASSTPSAPPEGTAIPSNLNIAEPSDLRSTITPDRSFKASSDVSSAELNFQTHSTPNSIEPQFVEDAQQAIAEPHFTDPVAPSMNLEDIPERIGYLKEVCGLDFGWGPTATAQFVIEQLHINGGFTWTASIILLGLAVRGMLFPALIGAAKEAQKMRDMKDVIAPIQADYKAAKARQDQVKMGQAAQRLMAVRKEFGLKLWKSFLPPLIQIPIGFGCWRLLRNAATLPVPGFITESWLWTTDLTFSDPYFIAPATSAFLIWATIKSNGRTNANAQSENVMAILQRIMPLATLVFMSFQPGAVQLYFVSSSAMGLLSALVLQQRLVRKQFGMPALPTAPGKAPTPADPNAPAAPQTITTTTGGLQRRSMAARQIETQRSAQLAAQQASTVKPSIFDKVVDGAKDQIATIKTSAKKISESSSIFNSEDRTRQNKMDQMEEYEARINAKLDRRRQERNDRAMGKR